MCKTSSLMRASRLWLNTMSMASGLMQPHTDYMDHGCVLRIAAELKGFKPDVLLIAENLPNQADLNRLGFDGFWAVVRLFPRQNQGDVAGRGVRKYAPIFHGSIGGYFLLQQSFYAPTPTTS
jgi:hypothetical protein